jgi:hypothetical protein
MKTTPSKPRLGDMFFEGHIATIVRDKRLRTLALTCGNCRRAAGLPPRNHKMAYSESKEIQT